MSDGASDPHRLNRFVEAQAPVIERVLEELARGQKESHWMWFIFPQLAGLGRSEMARLFGIASLDEARAYLAHPTLGPRLRECTELMLRADGKSAADILGSVDAVKFRSSMTLFAEVEPGGGVFQRALAKFYGGDADPQTLERLRAEKGAIPTSSEHQTILKG